MKAALIFNPRAGRGAAKETLIDAVEERLTTAGMSMVRLPTERMGHAIELARNASEQGFDLAIAWGGDGTLNEVATGLVGSETAMGVLPGGTVNVFARELGIPLKLSAALDVLAGARSLRIPVGLANGRPFLLMAGVGLDGEVVYRLKAGLKSALGALAFWLDGFRLLASYPMAPLRIRTAERELEGTALIAGKIRRYGPRYVITPDARLEEAQLDVVVFTGTHRRDYLRYLAGVVGGFHLSYEDIVHLKTDALDVDVPSGAPVRCQLDGEPFGGLPLELRVRDQALSVMLPPRGHRG